MPTSLCPRRYAVCPCVPLPYAHMVSSAPPNRPNCTTFPSCRNLYTQGIVVAACLAVGLVQRHARLLVSDEHGHHWTAHSKVSELPTSPVLKLCFLYVRSPHSRTLASGDLTRSWHGPLHWVLYDGPRHEQSSGPGCGPPIWSTGITMQLLDYIKILPQHVRLPSPTQGSGTACTPCTICHAATRPTTGH